MIRFIVGGIIGAVAASSIPSLRMPSLPTLPTSFPSISHGNVFQPASSSSTGRLEREWCFVPDGASCQALLIKYINASQKQILVQAYQFTNADIAKALVDAHRRGVDVKVILDKSQRTSRYSIATFLTNERIPLSIDGKPNIAHNKIMIFDRVSVFTGSYNFSKNAEKNNAENGIVFSGDSVLVNAYIKNWDARFAASTEFNNVE